MLPEDFFDTFLSPSKSREKFFFQGADLNPYDQFLVLTVLFKQVHLSEDFDPLNANLMRNQLFNPYLKENYGERKPLEAIQALYKAKRYVSV